MFNRYLLLSIFSFIFITLSGCRQNNNLTSRPEPLPQDALIQAYFNHNSSRGANYTDPYRQKERPGDNLEQIIIDAIASADQTIEVAIQEFRLPKIAQALVEKKREGVAVRVILENDYRRPWSRYSQSEVNQMSQRDRSRYQSGFNFIDLNRDGTLNRQEIEQRDALIILEKAGIPILDDTADGTKGSGLMHHKFMIIDEEILVATSANFTLSGIHGDLENPNTQGNANNLLTIKSEELASLFLTEFNFMWGDGVGGKEDSQFGLQKPKRKAYMVNIGSQKVQVNFSPLSKTEPWENSSNGFINQQLARAQSSVNFALFVFTDQKLADTLAQTHQRGTNIQGLIDSGFAYRYYSEGLDLLGVMLARNCKPEKNNNPWKPGLSSVGFPELPEGDKLHHKFAVVDQKTVITGSHNWSASANYQNDEFVLAIESPTVAAHYEREFQQLYDRAVLGIPPWLQQRIQSQKQECPNL
ncbi:phospholipase D/Transphosphatidylase [Halothece sp. PCC 7418]|uniref:phospholipase D-like domain-containing protein n=1 Tax=Halothece sp. (strain PCC 7418) TaxID=65093 RepID=UPI0002A06E34|nr:phospholipase D-like domain-containing protein [Halothece sp. PCC 7418]AFZ43143.1 phospholipase D/Transphosphatidylase [Halothece sp. PCC 7418]